MNAARNLLAITAGGAVGLVVAEVILGLGPRDAGICIAVVAGCVLLRYLLKAVQEDREQGRRIAAAKRAHPASQQLGRCMGCRNHHDLDALYLRGGLCLSCTHIKENQ